jgi:hypothetical protein
VFVSACTRLALHVEFIKNVLACPSACTVHFSASHLRLGRPLSRLLSPLCRNHCLTRRAIASQQLFILTTMTCYDMSECRQSRMRLMHAPTLHYMIRFQESF